MPGTIDNNRKGVIRRRRLRAKCFKAYGIRNSRGFLRWTVPISPEALRSGFAARSSALVPHVLLLADNSRQCLLACSQGTTFSCSLV